MSRVRFPVALPFASVAQWLERLYDIERVVGSTPIVCTNYYPPHVSRAVIGIRTNFLVDYTESLIFIFMIKLKSLLPEIALVNKNTGDEFLRKQITKAIGTPPVYSGKEQNGPEFGEYLTTLQDWAKQKIPEYGVLLDVPNGKLYKATAETEKKVGIYHFDDDYESFESFVDDHFDEPEIILIHTGQLARYLFGTDVANRIVIPGRIL